MEFDGDCGYVRMPKALEICEKNGYPMVRFKGIDHIIIEDDVNYPDLKKSELVKKSSVD